ncbi:MAG TPA: NADH-quinone oxidoreductase subunit NuoF [Anaeromyxobacteraceae bacterium]|nr:NADH-quinone oxidoreductase subunit NuoF [Anaeromyxobacteraceae bacterium]
MNSEELQHIVERKQAERAAVRHRVCVCAAAGCQSLGAEGVLEAMRGAVKADGLAGSVEVHGTGCLGLCHAGTMVQIDSGAPGEESRILYERVDAENAALLLRGHLEGRRDEAHAVAPDAPFFAHQRRIVLEGSGRLDPEDIEHCIGAGAYQALHKALTEMTSSDVVKEVSQSGLRGRGGAGYPTGLKWGTVSKATSKKKYVICNADEGDPGAFMDRSVLEGDPHRVLEGMAIAAYAVGADQGFIYVRGEYPLAIKRLKLAIKQAERAQLLGNRIFESGFNFRVDLRIGAGAFVCGEETALLQSVEGQRGQPRPRPPFPAQSGLWGEPTLINNVETFANIPTIVQNGGAWFQKIGTPKSTGTKVFALAGKINHTGLIEVPMGMTLRQILFDIGGGIPGGKAFKAAQTGGPSGGCIPAQHLDLPVDYESLQKVGTIMGSGGLIVMDETSCMVDVARFFMEFCMEESCGKCIPCRAGTVQMHDLLQKVVEGRAVEGDLDKLTELADLLKSTSLCGLGQTAPNPVVSTLRYFRDEYLAHIVEKRCPAGVCALGKDKEVAA